MANQVIETEDKKNEITNLLDLSSTKELITQVLGKNKVQTFIGSVLTAMQDPKLQDVEPQSLLNCFLKAATYNLPIDPNLGYAFPVPYKNDKNIKVAQFQMGTKGIVELALRSNQYRRLNVCEIREGEIKGYDFFGEIEIEWIKEKREKLPIIGYMAAYELTNGMRKRVYWDIEKIKNHALTYSKAHQYAKNYGKSKDDLWTNNFNAMAEKTVLKDLLKYAPKSIELQNALKFDQAVIQREGDLEKPIYIDNDSQEILMGTQEYDIDKEIERETNEKADNENIMIIPYSEYNPEIYEPVLLEGEKNAYDAKTKTIRVRLKNKS